MAQNDNVQNVVRSITDFLQQTAERQDVPQDVRDRANQLRSGLSQAGGSALSI
ncbi:hypothetical protein [Nonomuraea candida]|uniref:hypothetical protein n=1 Tax=Nonomuraea candida TaxID=359159 RepID=UPI000B16A5B5|nr:hypothetical protein [Nonomuraea candida]